MANTCIFVSESSEFFSIILLVSELTLLSSYLYPAEQNYSLELVIKVLRALSEILSTFLITHFWHG